MIKFSVITVCLNAGQDLLDTVDNTLAQTYENFEIIVKDGFSQDGSVEKLPHSDKIRLIQRKDTGIYDAMNQAVEEASGDYLIFMNAGDRFYNLEVLKKIAAGADKTCGKCYYGLCYNRKGDYVNAYPSQLSKMTVYRTMICHQSTIYARSLFAEHKYNTEYKILADREYLLWIRCKKNICPEYLDFIVVDYKADGVCESQEYLERNKRDREKMNALYFSRGEIYKFRFLYALTLPGIRKRIASHPSFQKVYSKTVQGIYHFFKA